jgi:hypothetical protein
MRTRNLEQRIYVTVSGRFVSVTAKTESMPRSTSGTPRAGDIRGSSQGWGSLHRHAKLRYEYAQAEFITRSQPRRVEDTLLFFEVYYRLAAPTKYSGTYRIRVRYEVERALRQPGAPAAWERVSIDQIGEFATLFKRDPANAAVLPPSGNTPYFVSDNGYPLNLPGFHRLKALHHSA